MSCLENQFIFEFCNRLLDDYKKENFDFISLGNPSSCPAHGPSNGVLRCMGPISWIDSRDAGNAALVKGTLHTAQLRVLLAEQCQPLSQAGIKGVDTRA